MNQQQKERINLSLSSVNVIIKILSDDVDLQPLRHEIGTVLRNVAVNLEALKEK